MAGFYCFGEIAPSAPGMPLHLQNGSLVAVLLGGERVPAAMSASLPELPCPAGEIETLTREVRSLTRALAQELGLTGPDVAEAALLKAMVEHPILVDRPIVSTPKGVILARPQERVREVL